MILGPEIEEQDLKDETITKGTSATPRGPRDPTGISIDSEEDSDDLRHADLPLLWR